MKRHPIDELFHRKLVEVEKQPSEKVWERLNQQRQDKQIRSERWKWYAAAALVGVVFFTAYLVWMQRATYVNPMITQSAVPIQDHRTESAKVDITERTETKLLTEKPIKKGKVIPVEVQFETPRELVVVDKIDMSQITHLETSGSDYKESATSLVMVEPTVVNMSSIAEQVITQSRTIVVSVEEETGEANEERTQSKRFKRILGQLKNVKQGERVDWEEVGVSPATLIARVDAKLRSGEEKISEKYQNLKERTKL